MLSALYNCPSERRLNGCKSDFHIFFKLIEANNLKSVLYSQNRHLSWHKKGDDLPLIRVII